MTRRHPLLLTLIALVAVSLLLPMPALAGKGGKAKKRKTKAEEVPTALELRARYLEITHEDTLYSHDSWKITGSFSIPAQGITGSLLVWAADHRIYTAIHIPGIGLMEEGYDGTTAWSNDPMQGPRIKDESETAQTAFATDVSTPWSERFEVMENLGAEEFEGRPVWRLRLVPRDGSPERTLMFDRETGLELAMITDTLTAMGTLTSVTVMGDWKTADGGFMYPSTIRSEVMGMQQVMSFDAIEVNPEGEPPFGPPPAVQALLEEGATAPESATPAEAAAPADGASPATEGATPAPEGATPAPAPAEEAEGGDEAPK